MMNKTCSVCCRPLNRPWVRKMNGRVVEGCVALDHYENLKDRDHDEVVDWYFRPQAVLMRSAERRRRDNLRK